MLPVWSSRWIIFENLHFEADQIRFLRKHPVFRNVSSGFFEYLREFRFTGEVWAMPEGTPAFGFEPLLRVTAPIIEAQIVETFLLTTTTFQTLIASKAARIVHAAGGRGVAEFGSRRAHGPEAGVLAARAAFIGGCSGTSNVEAGHRFGIPTYGTLAHSYVMAHDSELKAFEDFQRVFPEHAVLLIDTYDTLAAVDNIIAAGMRPHDVRLDSGDLLALSKEVRRRLDAAGLTDTHIVATSDLDEFVIERLLTDGAPIDQFGVGTALATSKDEPALGGVYKLVELRQGERVRYPGKFADDKYSYPGTKQVFRFADATGRYCRDLIARADEKISDAEALLIRVMSGGKRVSKSVPLTQIRASARLALAQLPDKYHQLRDPEQYPVEIGSALESLLAEARQQPLEQSTSTSPRAGASWDLAL